VDLNNFVLLLLIVGSFNFKHQTSEVRLLLLDPRDIPEPPEVKDAILFPEEGILHQSSL